MIIKSLLSQISLTVFLFIVCFFYIFKKTNIPAILTNNYSLHDILLLLITSLILIIISVSLQFYLYKKKHNL